MATPTTLPATFVAGNVLTAQQMNDLRGAFRILQVQTVAVTSTISQTLATAGTWYDVTGLSVSITPSATSSKVLVVGTLSGTNSATSPSGSSTAKFALTRDSTQIYLGDAAGNRRRVTMDSIGGSSEYPGTATVFYLDSPNTTSAVAYKWQAMGAEFNNTTFNLGRGSTDGNNIYTGRSPAGALLVMEVSA